MCFLLLAASPLFAGVIVLEGFYQNRNIYVQNSIGGYGVGFCVYEVRVNGEVCTDETNSSAFEIDLKQHGLEIGAPVVIMIKHKDDGCLPKVINPDALKPNPTFETIYLNVGENGLLQWTTVNETAKLAFVVEQFKWNKWVQIGEVEGRGIPTANYYTFKTTPIAGMNKFRVKQKGYIDKTKYSPSVAYSALKSEVTFVYNKNIQKIQFSENTFFEVFDKYGNLVKKGYGEKVDVSNLKKDAYYMNFGNTMGEFKKK